jgi:ABC-type uncharacterized transport system ATPase subunit
MTPPSDRNADGDVKRLLAVLEQLRDQQTELIADKDRKLLFMLEHLQGLREEMSAQHQRLRSDVNAGFQGATHEVQQLRTDMTTVKLDVNTLRTVREIEQQYSTRRATWAGLLAGFIFSVLMKLGDWLWHR